MAGDGGGEVAQGADRQEALRDVQRGGGKEEVEGRALLAVVDVGGAVAAVLTCGHPPHHLERHGPRRLARAHSRSKMAAMPCPPPMHMVTRA